MTSSTSSLSSSSSSLHHNEPRRWYILYHHKFDPCHQMKSDCTILAIRASAQDAYQLAVYRNEWAYLLQSPVSPYTIQQQQTLQGQWLSMFQKQYGGNEWDSLSTLIERQHWILRHTLHRTVWCPSPQWDHWLIASLSPDTSLSSSQYDLWKDELQSWIKTNTSTKENSKEEILLQDMMDEKHTPSRPHSKKKRKHA